MREKIYIKTLNFTRRIFAIFFLVKIERCRSWEMKKYFKNKCSENAKTDKKIVFKKSILHLQKEH